MRILRFPLIIPMVVAAACGGGGSAPQPSSAPAAAPGAPRANVSTDKNAYPVFPDADAGADPSVPAEQGGKGFKGDGWQTSTDFDLIGDAHALKGGVFRDHILDFPGTLRAYGAGPESNTQLNLIISNLMYESLLGIHPTTLEYIPVLATHWQISPDKLTFRFRINPNARWFDGEPVTADDVVATWSFNMDKGLQSPTSEAVFGKFEKPVAESKYIVRVKSKELNWRNFLYFSGMQVLPAHILKNLDGARYLKEYNFKLMPGTGPYTVNEADIVKGKSVTIRRRNGYWAEKHRRNAGLNNFDEIRYTVVRDPKLAFEMFKKGDLDFYYVNISRVWVEELNFDKVQRGLIQKRKVFNDYPNGIQGLGLNMRKAPFDDVRVREALAYLFNRELFIEKLFFREYSPLNSYHAGGIYENQNNPKMPYDPQLALKLLADAGWKDRDSQGRVVKSGQPLNIELLYSDKGSETYLTIYLDDLRKAGISVNLRLVTPETLFQLVMQRKFEVVAFAWGTAGPFPDDEQEFHSRLADVENTNNITGVKDKRLDQLLEEYGREFDLKKRAANVREADGILANIHPYVLEWYPPSQRVAYWNKFGHPESYLSRVGDYTDLVSMWWVDPRLQDQLNKAMADESIKVEVGQIEQRYWKEYAQRESQQATTK